MLHPSVRATLYVRISIRMLDGFWNGIQVAKHSDSDMKYCFEKWLALKQQKREKKLCSTVLCIFCRKNNQHQLWFAHWKTKHANFDPAKCNNFLLHMATVNDTYILPLIKHYAMTHESKKKHKIKKGNVANFSKYDFYSYISQYAEETIC